MTEEDPIKPKKLLTKKQAAFVKAMKDPKVKTITEAGRIAGYCSRQEARHALQSNTVKNELAELINELRNCGVNSKLYSKKAKEGLEASRGVDLDGNDMPDYKERREMLALCLKLEGHLAPREDSDKTQPIQIVMVNYDTTNPDSSRVIQSSSSGSKGSEGFVKIQDDYLAQES